MRIELLGVRGSTPAPGPAFVRYGGNTSCVAIGPDDGPPTLVLDAGTGIRRLPELLGDAPFVGSILLTHLHWDHTQGLPFSPSIDRDDAEVELWVPRQLMSDRSTDPVELLARAMSPPHFPIEPDGLNGHWTFRTLDPGDVHVAGFHITVTEIPHKGGRTFGFRISDEWNTVTYMPDHGPIALGPGPDGWGEIHPAALALCRGADLLLHDAQHTAAEFPARAHYGHSTGGYALSLGRAAGVDTVVLFHHDPSRADDGLDSLVGRLRASTGEGGPRVMAGAERDVFSLGRTPDDRGTRGAHGPARADPGGQS